jgi:DNA polymerase I-like protein with 3'-5' exonuclease and polymerase domains
MAQGVLTMDQLEKLVDDYLAFDEFVFDVESKGEYRGNPHRNEVFWISLAGPGRADAIPCGHPLGERIIRDPDDDFYRIDKQGHHQEHRINQSSGRPKWVTVPTPFEDPPEQLWIADVIEVLRPLLFSKKTRKIGQNVKFDLESLAKYFGAMPPGPYGDTITAAKLINENFHTYRLGDLVKREFHYEYEKIGKAGPEKFSYSEALLYSYLDAKYTWLLWQKYVPLMKKEGIRHIFDLEMELLPAVLDMECTGITIDEQALAALGVDYSTKMAALKIDIDEAYGTEINLNANAQVAELVYDILGHTCKVFTAKANKRSTAAATLEAFSRDPVVAKIQEHAKYSKLQSTFVLGIQRNLHNGRIHPNLNPTGTVTGRMSANEPNIQQIPTRSEEGKRVREVFIAG